MSDSFYIPDSYPFWFVDSELLTSVIVAEIGVARRLLADNPKLPYWFDNPDARYEERQACFAVVARASGLSNISDTIAARHEVSRSVSKEDMEAFERISNLI